MRVRVKLKEIAQQKGFSQRRLYLRSGVDIKTIRRIFNDPFTIVTTETLAKLAVVLDVDVSKLIESAPDEEEAP